MNPAFSSGRDRSGPAVPTVDEPLDLALAPAGAGHGEVPSAGSSERAAAWQNAPPRTNSKKVPLVIGPFLADALETKRLIYGDQFHRCARRCSEDSVHELRVATRRFLAQLAMLDELVAPKLLRKTRRLLKSRMTALGPLRDTHVQRLAVQRQTARSQGLEGFLAVLNRRERRLVKAAAAEISGWGNRKLDAWVQAIRGQLITGAGDSKIQAEMLSRVHKAMLDSYQATLERLEAIDPRDPATIHRVRIAFKKFRYMVEAMAPALPGVNEQSLLNLAAYQRKMGQIQDLEVLRDSVQAYFKSHPAEAAVEAYCRRLEMRYQRASRAFAKSAGALRTFWPLPAAPVSP